MEKPVVMETAMVLILTLFFDHDGNLCGSPTYSVPEKVNLFLSVLLGFAVI
jgi:multisubunit Na+/H+ antiporter MnhB subunit